MILINLDSIIAIKLTLQISAILNNKALIMLAKINKMLDLTILPSLEMILNKQMLMLIVVKNHNL
jgi:hypothetical protein